jgi:adenylate cyclase
VFREVDRVKVVGRDQPVDLFVPLPLPLDERSRAREEAFAMAVGLYRARAFEAAASALQEIASMDPVARSLLERCRRLLHEPPPAAWDGVWVAESK